MAAIVLDACKLVFSTARLAFGEYQLELNSAELQTLAIVTLFY